MKDVNSIEIAPAAAASLRCRSAQSLGFLLAAVCASLAVLQPGPLSAQSYLLNEGFEGAGYENSGWTAFSIIDPDYTANPLVGSQSLRCSGTSPYIQRPFVPGTSFYCYFQVRWLSFAPFKFVTDWLDAGSSSITRVVTDGFPNRLSIVHGGASLTGTTVIAPNTTYHVWVEWTRGTGSDGTMRLFISTTGVKPGSPEATITTGTGIGTITKFDIGPFDAAATTDVIYDRVLLDDEPIGSNPGLNAPPTITSIPNQTTPVSTAIGPIPFTIGDADTNANDLVLTGTSSNTSVVPNANIVFGGSGSNRTVTITPNPAVTANTTITITVSDGQAGSSSIFNLAVGNANTPSISAIANQSTPPNTPVGPINFVIGDVETPAASLTLSVTSTNTTLVPVENIAFGGAGSNRTVTVTPATGQTGVTLLTLFVTDGELTNSTSFIVSVANTPPTISNIADQSVVQDTTLGPINFTVGDAETPAANLTVTRDSSNTGLVPVSAISLGGSGANRTVTITPATGQTGSVTITLTVSDGVLTASDSFVLTVTTNPPAGDPGAWLLREDFEGPGYENTGWTPIGSPNPDYTINPLRNAESLHVASSSLIMRTFRPTNEFYLYCRLRWNNLVQGATAFYWETVGYNAAATLLIDYSTPRLYVSHGSASAIGTTTVQTNVTYHVWIEWTQGTGNNGTIKAFLSTDANKPASPNVTLSNGVGLAIERMYVGSINASSDMVADSILIASAPIGSNPGGNTPPSISDLNDQITDEDTAAGPLDFTVGDTETPANNLTLAGASSNTALIPNANIVFGGSGSNRTVTVTPAPNQSGSATITVTVSDGPLTDSDSFVVTVNAINDAPLVTLPSATADYTENALPVILDATATVADIDSVNLDGGSLTMEITNNGAAEDRLAIRNQGTGSGQIGVSGANVSYEGVGIGTFTGGISGSSPLVVSFNASATPQAAEALLRNITYENVSETPSTLLRTVRAVVQDGDGGNSAPVTLALSVTAVPDAPGLAWATPAPIVYGTALSASQLNATAAVPGTFVYAPAAGVVLNAAAGQLLSVVFTPDDAINYTSASTSVLITVTPAPLTITADNTSRGYGAANPSFSATYVGFVNGDTAGGLDTPVTLGTAADTNSPVGSYVITATGASDINYAITHVNGVLTVTSVPLVATADNQSKIYGEALPNLTGSLIGVQNGDNITATFTTTATAASDVGAYPITPVLADPDNKLSNYTVTLNNGEFTVAPAPLLITANDTNRLYGAANPVFTATYTGFVNGDDETDLDTPVSLTTTATAASPVDTYVITASGATDFNYAITHAPGTLTINPADLLVTANSTNRIYGQTNPLFTVTYAGFVNGDDADDLSGTLDFTTLAETNSPVGDYFVTPSGLTSANYIFSYDAGILTITPAALIITANNVNRPYGETNPPFSVTYTGFVNDDDETDLEGTLAFTSPAGIDSPVGVYPITPLGLTAPDNYVLSFVSGELHIMAAPLVATADPQSKLYGAAVPTLTGTLVGVHNGDAITAIFTTTATASSDAGLYPIAPVLVDPNNMLTNYTVTLVNATLTNLPAPLTITAGNKSKLYGAANPALTASYTGFVNGDDETDLDTPVILSTSADAASPVGAYAITATGATDLNYAITHVAGTLTVNPAPLLVTANNAARLYGAANPTFTASYAGFVNGDDETDLTGTLAFTTPAEATSPVGTYAITPSGLSAANYAISFANGTLTVTPALLTITAENKSRLYGAANPTFTASYAGFVNGDDETDLTGTLLFTTPAEVTSPVGTYVITPSGLNAANYAISFANGTLTVTAAALTATADPQTKVYGQALPALTGSLVGVLNGDNITATFTTTATASSDAGSYPIIPVLADPDNKLGNYTVTLNNDTLTVTPALLTITAENKSRLYGVANPTLTASYAGFVNGDDAADLDTAVALATTADATSPVGTYLITATGAADLNYAIIHANGTLTVSPAPLLVTANNAARAYGQTNPLFTATITGFVNGDDETDLTGTLVFTTLAETNSPIGTYAITPSGLNSANYAITFADGTLTVAAYALTATADPQSKLYGAAVPTLTGTLVGVHNGDAITAIFTTTATASSDAGLYPITPVLVDPNNMLTNYTVTLVNATLTNLPAPLTITAGNKSKLYGAANPALTASYTGFVNGDDETDLDTPVVLSTSADAASPVGAYAITATGATDLNYAITHVAGTLTVNPAPLLVTANNAARLYGAANPTFTASYAGFVNGDDETDLTGTLAFTTPAEATSPVGTYAITPSGLSAANYAISFANGTLTVNPAPLLVTANNTTRLYGAANPTFTASYAGFVNGDDETDLTGTLLFTTSAQATSPVGTYPITPSGLSAANYAISFANGTLTVTPALLTITAEDKSRLYGAANPALTASYAGFVNGDDETDLDTAVALATTADATSPVGTYAISATGAADLNYAITHVAGTLTVNPAPLTITAENKSKLYGATNPALTASYAGFVNGDDATDLDTAVALATTADATSPVGTYAISATGATDLNYTITHVAGTLAVSPAPLIITADDKTKVSGAPNPPLTASYAGFVNGDDAADLDTPVSLTTAATTDSPAGAYSITASGAVDANYSITFVPGTLTVTGAASVGIAILGVDAAGAATVRLTSDPGRIVTLQATSNFADWEDVITLPNITGTIDYIDVGGIGKAYRFYRARTP
jgi:hypothetical protein